mgnify:FL=1
MRLEPSELLYTRLYGLHVPEPRACTSLSDIGKPRLVGDPAADAAELATWRQGMQKLAQLPQVSARLEP